MNNKKKYSLTEKTTRILIIDDRPFICQKLTQFVNQKCDLVVCAEAEDGERILDTLKKKHIDADIAIVNSSFEDTAKRLTERIKLQYPNLPVLVLSIGDKEFCHSNEPRAKECFVNREVAEQITEAIRYAQSLIKNYIFGFTVPVNIKNSMTNSRVG